MIKNIEKIKTIVLWFLFISSIALVIIRYNLISFEQISGESRFYNDSVFENIIIPKHISIRFGQYDMTEILLEKNSYYGEIKQSIATALRNNEGIKKIEKNQYDEVKSYNNVLLKYENIPSIYIEKSVRMKNTLISNLGYVSEICLILGKKEIYIKSSEGYYKLTTNSEISLNRVNLLENTAYEKYYPKFENMNSNFILLPLSFNKTLKNIGTMPILEEHTINNIANNILRDRFDFSSSIIQKNGVYFYSYNNGQEILKINKKGYLEYKKESVEHVQDDIEKSTKAMLSFLHQLGIDYRSIAIESVQKVDTGSKKLYKFVIKHQKDGVVVEMLSKSNDAVITVVGDNVVSASIMLRNVGDYIGIDSSVSDPSKALDSKIGYIKKVMNKTDVSEIISHIKDISLVYMKGQDEEAIPTWKYEIGDYVFFINAINGDVESYAMGKI
ncbi:hypothetical protein HMPREF0379_1448 [[Eubacterium] yurii subsp. margaretiae ATCC 43715]|nr:hypothetical protein HMPREF0379_1448 [[Eubacterium] yurii subsp. margaretiae ATCC 43715]